MLKYSLVVALLAVSSFGNNILVNPDFEEDDMSSWVRTVISGIRPWSIGAADPQSGQKYVFTVDEASLQQSFDPVDGGSLDAFSFWADRPATAHLSLELIYSDNSSSGSIDLDSLSTVGWSYVDALPYIDTTRHLSAIKITKTGINTVRLDNFKLFVAPVNTEIRDFDHDGGSLEFSLKSLLPGETNALQVSTNLIQNSWQTVETFVSSGTESNLTYTITNDFPVQFFRIIKE